MSRTHMTIAQVNDFFRKAILTNGVTRGKCVLTQGIATLDSEQQVTIIERVQTFSDFTPDNDPYGEHDFGTVQVAGVGKIYWRIDYYADETMQAGAEDIIKAYRVLTIMLADEY